jgi:hypothetical protein
MIEQFESEFSKMQSDMVSVCLEYCYNKCEQLYIYILISNDTLSSDFFFRIDGELRRKNKLNGIDSISPLRQKEALKIISSNALKIIELFEQQDKQIPCEIKIRYNVADNSAKCDYSYETPDKSALEMTEIWYNAIKAEGDL